MSSSVPLTAGVAVPGPELTRAARLNALADLDAAGWPTRRREQWRYTDLEPLAAAGFDLAPKALDRETIAAAQRLEGAAAPAHPGGAAGLRQAARGEALDGVRGVHAAAVPSRSQS